MRIKHLAFPVFLTLAGFSRRGSINTAIATAVVGVACFQSGLVIACSYLDGTWILESPAKGLFAHYGAWATIVTDPLLLLTTAFAYRQFQNAMITIPIKKSGRDTVRKIVAPYYRFLRLQENGWNFYALAATIGMLAWLNNIRQTYEPNQYYQHDVFDSASHIYGFAAHKLTLLISWVIVYPASGFLNVSMCLSAYKILEHLKKQDLISPSISHPDGCYGLAAFGKLNVALLVPYLLAFIVIFALITTHQHGYLSAGLPLVVLSTVFIAMSFITIKPLAGEVRRIRRELYRDLADESTEFGKRGDSRDALFGTKVLLFLAASGSPYSPSAKAALILLRTTPAFLTAFKLYHDFYRQ